MSAIRKNWTVATAGLGLGLVWFVAACGSTAPQPPEPAVHTVLLWLKRPGSVADHARLSRAAESLRFIPGVVRVEAGRQLPIPAEMEGKTFDFGVAITFRDRAALLHFESDRQRKQAMARYLGPIVRRYVVYDSGVR